MGVYVKGMEMPESCYKCKLDLRTDACPAFDEWHKEYPYSIRAKDRLPDCPLVEVPEPHGRLIDADEITAFLELERNNINVESLDEFPTVIEAEDE